MVTYDGDVVGGRWNDFSDDEEHDEESQQRRNTERDLVTTLRRQPVYLYTRSDVRLSFLQKIPI